MITVNEMSYKLVDYIAHRDKFCPVILGRRLPPGPITSRGLSKRTDETKQLLAFNHFRLIANFSVACVRAVTFKSAG